jgi:hypothetical protein
MAAPHAVVVLFEVADVREAHLLDPRFRLTLGEAVAPGDRRLFEESGLLMALFCGPSLAGGL